MKFIAEHAERLVHQQHVDKVLINAVEQLNHALEVDYKAIEALYKSRAPCIPALAEHPTFLVRGLGENTTIGLLGILNGILGESSYQIAASVDEVRDENGNSVEVLQSFQAIKKDEIPKT